MLCLYVLVEVCADHWLMVWYVMEFCTVGSCRALLWQIDFEF